MVRRFMLALAFVAALGVAGVGLTGTAQAHGGGCYRPLYNPYGYVSSYGVYGGFYGPPAYSAYSYGFPSARGFYGGRGHHRGRGHGGFSISIGF